MKVSYTETKVYDWDSLQAAICEVMGIQEEAFRDYHKVVGGDYKDLWHVALDTIIPNQMSNDTIVTMYPIEDQIDDDSFWLADRSWAKPMLEAYGKLMKELDPNHDGIKVRFSW